MRILKTLQKVLFSRISVCAVSILIQLSYIATLFWTLGTMFSYSYIVFFVIGIVMAIYIMNKDLSPGYKLIWVFTLLSLPIFGCMLYFFFGRRKPRHHAAASLNYKQHLNDDSAAADQLLRTDDVAFKQAHYIRYSGGYPLYYGCQVDYYSSGEMLYPHLIKALNKAKRFIFVESFILESGRMWDSILEILKRKVAENVEVRVMYDDFGCLMTLPRNYRQQLEENGIQCRVFGRLKPYWTGRMNNRDHRKIIVIDGKVAVTGGINLADEYINTYPKHGYWKDSALIIRGAAASSFTMMYLELWNTLSNEYNAYPKRYFLNETRGESKGFCIPYADSPDDDELLGENVYLNMIYSAKRYVYITTPYLILDNEIQEALILAAKNGIDVRIITPHIPDKKFVHAVTRANYPVLLQHGVRIFEFLPGFIHAKNFISDDKSGVVGTINLDFRSLYLHYECGVWLYDTRCLADIKQDFLTTLQHSKEITLEDTIEHNLFVRAGKTVLRLFSPMM